MLSQSEQIIQSAIKNSNVPFLGLLADRFTAAVKVDIEIAVLANPTVHGYINYLQRYPALFSVNLCAHVMKGMGSAGHFELYPFVQEAIGTEVELTGPDREKLWRAYRQAILTLGLEPSPRISGTHYMADEYLRQAGVPLAFIDDLAERMLSFAKRVGLPDQDDPEGVMSWQASLDSRLEQPFSRTARKAVALDSQGFYTQVFLKVYGQGLQEGSGNALERGMAFALKQRPASSAFRRAVLPYLMLHDGTLGVFIAGDDERGFELDVDGTVRTFRAGIEDRFVAIHEPLPQSVSIREVDGRQTSRYLLWEDNRPNRILAFSDTGRFKGRAQLGQLEPLVLSPGCYTFLSRFSPSDINADELWSDPKQYTFQVLVHPGSLVTIGNGPAKLAIQGESQPFARWQGPSKTTKEGIEFFFGSLELAIEFPVEWLVSAGDNYVLRLSFCGNNERLESGFSLDAEGRATLDILMEASRQGWRPAFGRVLAEICRHGEGRALLRTATFYWHGLRAVGRNFHFDCVDIPNNFQRMLSANVCVDGTTLKLENRHEKALRLVFKLDERRNQSLSWNAPGVFVEVEVSSEGGHSIRHVRSLGSVEAISYTSAKQIHISATEPGMLSLGEWSQRVDFSKAQTKTISAAFLAGRILPKASNLMYRNEQTGVELTLLRLVQPHHALKISSKNSGGQFVVRIDLAKEVTAVLVRAQDVISGEDIELTLDANSGQYRTHRFGRAQLICSKTEHETFSAYIHFEMDIWPSGAWVFNFDGCIDGSWGHLENERQDQFAVGMLCEDNGVVIGLKPFLACLTELPERLAIGVLERVQKSLLACYSTDSWTSLNWLVSVWETLLNRWTGREEAGIVQLVALVALRPPDDCAPSWMLQQTVASRMPRLFGLPASMYGEVRGEPNVISQALRAIAHVDKSYPAIFPHPLHSAAATGFPNFAAVVNGAVPLGFLLSRYTDALRDMGAVESTYQLESDSYIPGPGDFLGPLHFKHAMRQLELAFERSLGGNEVRCGQAIGLCSRVRRLIPVLVVSDAPRLAGNAPHLTPWQERDGDDLDSDIVQRRENLANIAHTLSLLAYYCRREARKAGHLDSFKARVAQPEIAIEISLAYLLQVGEGVFAFYLLLWELAIKAEKIDG